MRWHESQRHQPFASITIPILFGIPDQFIWRSLSGTEGEMFGCFTDQVQIMKFLNYGVKELVME